MSKDVTYKDKPWLSSYQEGVAANIDYEKMSLPEFLDRSAGEFADGRGLVFMGYTLTYKEVKDMVDRFATCLTDFGIQKGDSVSVLLPNMIPCVVAYYAILKIGAIAVMNNPLYSDVELEHQFNDSGSKILVCLDLLANRMIDLRPKTGIKQIVVTSIGDYLPFPKSLLFPLVAKKKGLAADVKTAPDVFKWKEVIKKYAPNPPEVKLSFDDIAMYQYTGGTTGVAKGVVLTHGNLSMQAQQVALWFPDFNKGEEIMIGALPFFHVFGLTCAMNYPIFMGWPIILVPKPQTEELLETFKKFKPTYAPMVPTMYIGLVNSPNIEKVDMTCINACFSGSAPIPVEIIKEFEKKTGALICEGFGMTESSPVTHINPFVQGKTKVGSIGIPLADVESRIVDMDDGKTEVAVGEPGELCIKGPQVMQGYKGLPNETADALKDGWLHTGDVAKMDEEGYFYIVDRMKDMIISGGYNVYPRDIDEVFYQHPKVEEACSIGVPHAVRGESVKVFVVLKAGQTATKEELVDFCKDKLAKYKHPDEVEFRKELPMSAVGKILRKDLKAEEMGKRG
ncbi:MAG: long-chain fatty acid--CoA ligase [bacterium]|nr:long-chain fatty acid--CoA ligase [bacterium]